MPELKNLMSLPGSVAAFTFSDVGQLTNHILAEDTTLNELTLDMLAHVCVANRCIASMQARGWEKITNSSGFYPTESFCLIGFEWSAVVSGGTGVVMRNDQADYEAAFKQLAN